MGVGGDIELAMRAATETPGGSLSNISVGAYTFTILVRVLGHFR